jgi:hypothetical protein
MKLIWNQFVKGDFIMFEPDNGKPIPENKNQRFWFYDNDAFYICAMLHDENPDKF